MGWFRKERSGERVGVVEARLEGFRVIVNNTRPDIDSAVVLRRLGEALAMIAQHVPHHSRHMRRDFDSILVQRYACRGAYLPDRRACLVELTFTVNQDFSISQIAATILHEAMHARLHQLGFPLEMEDRARQERFCRRAEIEFGSMVPDGKPIVQRALAALAAADDEIAPRIDPILAARRVAHVDKEALDRPRWLKRMLVERERPSGGDS